MGRGIFQNHGNGANGFQVFGDILPHLSISPGCAPDELSVNVLQRHGKSINFRLYREGNAGKGGQNFSQKIVQLLQTEYILKAHQGNRMGHLLKLADGFTAHTLGRRIRLNPFRVLRFQLLQFPQKPVIFKIRHLWSVQYIVLIICLFQNFRQLIDSFFRFHSLLLYVKMYREPPPQSQFGPQPPGWSQ